MKISIITVTWNSAATVTDTLRSVNSQTHPNVEHIVVDGGSTDATIEIVRAEGKRVVKLVSEADDGIYDAMNKGLSLATGDVVGLINSDDFYASPEAVAKVAAAFADPNVDAVYADLCYVAQDDVKRIVRYWRSTPFEPGLFARGWAPPHPTLFVRREFFDRFGNFDLAFPRQERVERGRALLLASRQANVALDPPVRLSQRSAQDESGATDPCRKPVVCGCAAVREQLCAPF